METKQEKDIDILLLLQRYNFYSIIKSIKNKHLFWLGVTSFFIVLILLIAILVYRHTDLRVTFEGREWYCSLVRINGISSFKYSSWALVNCSCPDNNVSTNHYQRIHYFSSLSVFCLASLSKLWRHNLRCRFFHE